MKHPDKQLTEKQKDYIRKHYKEMSALAMSRNLPAPVHRIRIFLNENGLDPMTPEQWNARKEERKDGFFNVSEKRGEYTWLV